jgi:hypothetical protein
VFLNRCAAVEFFQVCHQSVKESMQKLPFFIILVSLLHKGVPAIFKFKSSVRQARKVENHWIKKWQAVADVVWRWGWNCLQPNIRFHLVEGKWGHHPSVFVRSRDGSCPSWWSSPRIPTSRRPPWDEEQRRGWSYSKNADN